VRAALCVPLLMGAAALHAGPFDERVPAPPALDAIAAKARVREYFDAYERMRSAHGDASVAQLRDRAAYQRWSTLQWQLKRNLDERKPLGDLAEFGLIGQEDGSYSVRLKDYPQWAPLDSLLTVLRDPVVFAAYAAQLQARGFRDQDVQALKAYIEKNNPERAAFAANKPLIETFAAKVQGESHANGDVDRELVMAYVYQRERNWEEAQRAWSIGLLDVLDAQRQRILMSFFRELDITHVFGPEAASIDELVKQTVAPLISGEYVQALRNKEAEVLR
jgi:hypothetical protein